MRKFMFLLASAAFVTSVGAAAPQRAKPTPKGASVSRVAARNASKPQLGTFGFDEAGMNRQIQPGANFYDYANGGWLNTTTIPQDRASYGMFTRLADLSQTRTRTILDEKAKTPGNRIGDLYATFMDEAAAERAGIAPLRPVLDEIKAIGDPRGLAAEMGKLRRIGVGGPFNVGVGQDDKNPESYIVRMNQGGLGLPDRTYYLDADPKLAEKRAKYPQHLARLMTLAGETNAEARAAAVLQFETRIAQAHWTRIESRDRNKAYNKLAPAQLASAAPGFDFATYLEAAGLADQAAVLVAQPTAFTGMAQVVADTPLPVLKDYLLVRTISRYAPYLSTAFVNEAFDFNGRTLSGTPELQQRWKRGVGLVDNLIGEDLGQEYVKRYFPPASKAAADQLVRNVIAAMGSRIDQLTWMSPETKVKAHAKLAAFRPKIGYPDKWRDYSALKIVRGDLVGDVQRANAFEYQRNLGKLGGPLDRDEWGMTPSTINAYANFGMNEIVFPAAILQPPFFDPNADPAVNYGGIGVVIGHELSHHFDDQGAKYDMRGQLTDWWTPADVEGFKALTDQLAAQYDAYEPLPGTHIQGKLTLGENIADLAGLAVSMDAYHRSLGGRPARVIDGFTGDQRFYLGYAQVWRIKFREAALLQQLLTDPHSPGEYRTWEVRNADGWYAAFNPSPTDKMYLAPEKRVRIW